MYYLDQPIVGREEKNIYPNVFAQDGLVARVLLLKNLKKKNSQNMLVLNMQLAAQVERQLFLFYLRL